MTWVRGQGTRDHMAEAGSTFLSLAKNVGVSQNNPVAMHSEIPRKNMGRMQMCHHQSLLWCKVFSLVREPDLWRSVCWRQTMSHQEPVVTQEEKGQLSRVSYLHGPCRFPRIWPRSLVKATGSISHWAILLAHNYCLSINRQFEILHIK